MSRRKPERQLYIPPSRRSSQTQEEHTQESTLSIDQTDKSHRIVHAWEVAPTTSSPVKPVIHAWETNESPEPNLPPSLKNRIGPKGSEDSLKTKKNESPKKFKKETMKTPKGTTKSPSKLHQKGNEPIKIEVIKSNPQTTPSESVKFIPASQFVEESNITNWADEEDDFDYTKVPKF